MSDDARDDFEERLRRSRLAGPPADLKARILAGLRGGEGSGVRCRAWRERQEVRGAVAGPCGYFRRCGHDNRVSNSAVRGRAGGRTAVRLNRRKNLCGRLRTRPARPACLRPATS